MEHTMTREPIWKMWVDTRRRVVSFTRRPGHSLWNSGTGKCFCGVWIPIPISCTAISERIESK